jgi:hypothetical protein
MRIAVTGASGRAGSRIAVELARRGHAVTAIARNPEKIASLPNITARKGDVFDQAGMAALWAGHDAAVSSVHFLASDPAKLIAAARASGVSRYLVVGGAGSLEVAPGIALVTTSGFPAQYKPEVEKGAAFLAAAAGKGTQLDLPVALGAVRGGGADRQVPARHGPAVDRPGRKKLDFLRGFRSCARRRNRAARLPETPLYRRLLTVRSGSRKGGINQPVQAFGCRPLSGESDIVCHMAPLYKARARET